MRSQQDKLTDQVDAVAAALGLEAVQTFDWPNRGHWWLQDGDTLRLHVAFDFQADHASWTVDGPAADLAAKSCADLGSAAPEGRHHSGGHFVYEARIEYALRASWGARLTVADALGWLAAMLQPWRTAESFRQQLEAVRGELSAAYTADTPFVGALTEALAQLGLFGAVPDWRQAAHWIDQALATLPRGTEAGKRLAELADELAVRPAA